MNPFQIDGPAVISFSGGRTSAYMLRQIQLQGLRPDVYVVFADTAKERKETYLFLSDVARQWDVEIHHVQRPGGFTQLITDKKFLPNPVMRFCTQELKLKPMRDFMLAKGYDHWTNVVGIRADEPRRVAKIREAAERRSERWDIALPLVDGYVTLEHVNEFWSRQPFVLDIKPHEGNCDLCFLKGYNKVRNIIRDRPDLAQWWAAQEARIGGTFRADRPSYAAMLAQPDLFKDSTDESLMECFCHD